MIRITIVRDSESKNGRIRGFRIKGHAGQAPEGSDIVCAAVSAVAYTAAGALEGLAGISTGSRTEKDGYMEFGKEEGLEEGNSSKADIILDTAEIGFRQIAHSYGRYVRIETEVRE